MPLNEHDLVNATIIPCRSLTAVLRVGRSSAFTWELMGLPLILSREDKESFVSAEVILAAEAWLKSFGRGRKLMIVAQDQSWDFERGRITLISPYDPVSGTLRLEEVVESFRSFIDRNPIAILAF